MKRILLVTGSRALADTPRAKRWARARLHESIAWMLDAEAALLMHGGCWDGTRPNPSDNPDWWAHEIVVPNGIAAEVYTAIGAIEVHRRDPSSPAGATATYGRWAAEGAAPTPLERNVHMIGVAAARAKNIDVRVVGLVAPWSTTRGTHHTLRQARDRGFTVVEHLCPREYAPPGERSAA